MNYELAYCLERFIDDQIQLIDDYMETVKENEATECRRIEEMRQSTMTNGKPPTNVGSHEEDAAIAQRFIDGLLDTADSDDSAAAKDMKRYWEMLCIEFSAKIDDCLHHVIRLRKLARPTLRSTKFVIQCDEAIKRLRQGQKTKENYDKLYQVLIQSDQTNIVTNVQNWWNKTYGAAVLKVIHLNKAFNPGIGNSDIAIVPSWSQMIDCARKLLSVRNQELLINAARKYDLVYEFAHQIRSVDDENRQEIREDDLINQLSSEDVSVAMNYAETWLKKRDVRRRQKKDSDTYDRTWQEAKVQFDRQRVAQQSKKLALASLLCRLAIGSDNTERFDQKLKKTLEQQKQINAVPVITGDIGEPTVKKLSLAIQLDQVNINEWSKNSNQIQEKFSTALCQAFLIPLGSICITRIERDTSTLRASVTPPYGKNVIDSLNGTATDSPARVKAVRKCCLAVKGDVKSITLGEYDLSIDQKLMDPTWNRKYLWSKSSTDEGEYWKEPIKRGGKPYFCPSGWIRFGIKVAENDKEFDALWGNWYLAYHGTKSKFAVDILTAGLRLSTTGCYYDKGIPRVYVSPSIEYCAHERYAKPWTKMERNGKLRWFQVVLQCRVNPKAVKQIKPETLLGVDYKKKVKIDPNFDNNELEWVIPGKEGTYYMKDDIICYGLMMRISDVEPEELPTSKWWKYIDKQE